MGRATTIIIRKTFKSKKLLISLRRLPVAPYIYPMNVRVAIPSASGGTETTTVIPVKGPKVHKFSVEIPKDLQEGVIMDVEIRAGRVTMAPDVLSLRSFFVEEIIQQP